jgi:hypothetical protein
MSDEDRPYGHAGWNQGIVWPNSAIIYNELGWDYGPDNRPPLNVRQADFSTLPRLLYDEQIDMATNAPPVGTSTYLVGEHADDPPLKPIKWEQVGLEEAGLSPRTLNLGGFTSRKEFSDNNEGAMLGWMRAWEQGVEWAATPDNWGGILDNEDNWDYLAAESREEAEINLHFSFAENPAEDPVANTENPLPVVLKDFTLTEERIEQYKDAIRAVQESGALGDGDWESRLEFKALSL